MFVDFNKGWSVARIMGECAPKQSRACTGEDVGLKLGYIYHTLGGSGVCLCGFRVVETVRSGLGRWPWECIARHPCRFISYDSWLTDGRDAEWIFRSLGFITLVFEASFIFAIKLMMGRRRVAFVVMAVGIGLHGGIATLFPLPLFGWGYAAFFLLLAPVRVVSSIGGLGLPFSYFTLIRNVRCVVKQKRCWQVLDWFRLVSFEPVQLLCGG